MTKMMKFKELLAKKANLSTMEKKKEEEEKIEIVLEQFKRMVEECDDELVQTWRYEDEFLVRFIRGRKYNLASAFEKLQINVHVKRTGYPDIFKTLYPSALKDVLERKMMCVLKHRDELGRHVVAFKPELFDPNETAIDDLLRYQIMVVWEMMSHKETQINGITVLVNGSGFSPNQIKVLSPHNVQKYVTLSLKCSPTRFKGCHILFLPSCLHFGMQFVRPLLPEKVRSRIFSHGSNLEDFYKIFPQHILPVWLGGTLCDEESYADTNLEDTLLGKDEYFKELIQ